MSMFKSLQNAPRVISVFTKTPTNSALLNSITAASNKLSKNYQLEIHTKFPTYDQLQFLNNCKPHSILQSAIPFLKTSSVANFSKEEAKLLSSKELQDIADKKYWFGNKEFWVDWENQKLGDNMTNFPKA